MRAIVLRPATREDTAVIMRLWTEAAERLHAQGHDQWNYPVKVDNIHRNIDAGTCWLIYAEDQPDPIGTVTVDDFADPRLWAEADAPDDALYVHRLVLRADVRGAHVGSAVLDWAASRAVRDGRKWLRLDAWTTNEGLHAYYLRHGFTHVRTVTGPDIVSGVLFQRDATVRLGVGPAVIEHSDQHG